ncbi:hypothetical protein SODG_000019 [Sodalis praecaptivus]|uniref:hypothetical protein n=1 Tax=Sodalis praecaptivus TaxID=1239307 RepID=UPI0027F3FB40|nr:hypothetical protein [Sodalis praecaptivus]CAJ0999088.1 hypothetical protein NVIRENTERO_03648 [Sodalis praecaptivus]
MSLEANLERNNQLLAEHNALLAQLLAKMHSEPPAPISSIAESAQPAAAPTPEPAAQPEPAAVDNTPLRDIETLDKHTVVALAVLYPEITPEDLTDAHAEAANELRSQHQSTPQSAQCDELFMALAGVKPAINIPRRKLLEIAQTILKYWDILPGIEDRREYGYQLLGSHPDKRHSAKPPEVKSKKSTTAKAKAKASDASELSAEGPDGAPHGSRSPDDIPASGPPDTPDKDGTADIAALREKGRRILVNRLASAEREAIAQVLAQCGVKSISKSPDDKVPAVVAALEQLADELGG